MHKREAVVETVQVVRHHADEPAENRVHIIFDADTGRRIGHSPAHTVDQVSYTKSRSGVITTTLKIKPAKGA